MIGVEKGLSDWGKKSEGGRWLLVEEKGGTVMKK